MLCRVFRSSKKAQAYIYIAIDGDTAKLPQGLLDSLGDLEQVLLIDLGKRKELAQADPIKVMKEIKDSGYYLQLPPGPDSYLTAKKASKAE